MAAVALGDRDAFAELYTTVFPLVRAGAVRVMRDRGLAEEVAQEVIAELWTTAERYRPERGSMIGWALLIAHRRAVDRLRQHQAGVRRDLLAASRDHRPAHDSVLEQVEEHLEHQEVRRCLVELSPCRRQSLELAFYQERTHAQAADLLGIPVGTFKSRVRDSLSQLRRQLAEKESPRARPAVSSGGTTPSADTEALGGA
ncbi:sigma-70 family RNA polymerase sigma factor [Streptacidiphilus cavernicola]|uniref:Sigma-70 family RNA polymerase sigma factor n=1 Tax=Streptacidiphilus cavernicola TaxID=3342716 RepID=A0ABV6VQ68_9ACTN